MAVTHGYTARATAAAVAILCSLTAGCAAQRLQPGWYATAIAPMNFRDQNGRTLVVGQGFDYFYLDVDGKSCLSGTDYTVTRFPKNTTSLKEPARLCVGDSGHLTLTLNQPNTAPSIATGALSGNGFTLQWVEANNAITTSSYVPTSIDEINRRVAALQIQLSCAISLGHRPKNHIGPARSSVSSRTSYRDEHPRTRDRSNTTYMCNARQERSN